jgi:hypothetical protein
MNKWKGLSFCSFLVLFGSPSEKPSWIEHETVLVKKESESLTSWIASLFNYSNVFSDDKGL